MNNENPHISGRYEQWLTGRADANMREALREFTLALQSGAIDLPAADAVIPTYAGGVNYCPNSDLKFSKMAIEVAGAVPADVGDTNHECYRFFRQLQTDDVVEDAAHALKAVDHSLYAANEGADEEIPIWDRVNGFLHWGSTGDLWDVAIKLYNNDIKPGNRWHIRFVLGALTDDLVPDDLEMFCEFWHRTAADEGIISGGNFDLEYSLPPDTIAGTKELNYMAVAKTDGGVMLYSQVLNVTDAPNTLGGTNLVRVSYASVSGSGFVEFTVYREDVAAGTFHKIAFIRNANELVVDDDGDNVAVVDGFPTATNEITQAVAYSQALAVGAFGEALIINDFTIKIPDDYNWSETEAFSQYFRFGFRGPTAINRQIRVDQIYLGPTYNRWSDSPFDPKDAIPSTSQTSGTPTTGGNGGPPGSGGGNCIRMDIPVLRLDFDEQHEWMPFRDIPGGDLIENGEAERNVVRCKQTMKTRVFYRIDFSNGVWIFCNRAHRLRLDKEKHSEAVNRLKTGDQVWGWTNGEEGPVTIRKKRLIKVKRPQEFGTFSLVGERSDGDHFYIAGYSRDGNSGVFNKNLKPPDEVGSGINPDEI